MGITDQINVAYSIDQAEHALHSAYTLIVSETDSESFKITDGILKSVDYQKSLNDLSKIAIMCRRLEFEIREHNNHQSL